MNIYAEYGDKVVFAFPDNGYSHDQKLAAKHLKAGGVYTVDITDVHSCHTDVFLREVPGIPFNSVLFADVEDIKMKIFQENRFQPIHVVLETQVEATAFLAAMTTGRIPNGAAGTFQTMGATIDDFYVNVAKFPDGEGSDLD